MTDEREDRDERETTGRRKGWKSGVVAGGAALGMTLAGLGIAVAQTDEPATTTTAVPSPDVPAPPLDKRAALAEKKRAAAMQEPELGRFGPKFGMGQGIHGEFTRKARDGSYQTIATQVGDVTAVSSTSVTVKSEDGFTRTYAVDDNTLVNAGNDGIADVKTGDDVAITALVVDGKASAVDLHDVTRVRELRDRWAPDRG